MSMLPKITSSTYPQIDENRYSLSELLPYDTNQKKKDLSSFLKHYDFLLYAGEQTFIAITGRRYEWLDALVGVNACHLHAIRIALRINEIISSFALLFQEIVGARTKIPEIPTIAEAESTLKNVLRKNRIDVWATSEQLFCIACFLLTITKSVEPSKLDEPLARREKVAPEKLLGFYPGFSTSFSKKVVQHLRTFISKASVEFVQKTALSLADKSIQEMTSQNYVVNVQEKFSIPFFLGM